MNPLKHTSQLWLACSFTVSLHFSFHYLLLSQTDWISPRWQSFAEVFITALIRQPLQWKHVSMFVSIVHQKLPLHFAFPDSHKHTASCTEMFAVRLHGSSAPSWETVVNLIWGIKCQSPIMQSAMAPPFKRHQWVTRSDLWVTPWHR